MTYIKIGAILAIIVAPAVATSCSSSKDPGGNTTAAAPSTTQSILAECYPTRSIDQPDPAAFATALQLPPRIQLFSVKADDAISAPGKKVVYVDLCVPDTRDPDSLRSVATDIAHTLKKTELGRRTAVLYVTDAGTRAVTADKSLEIVDREFQTHPWDGTPSPASELQTWEIARAG
ncbi:hypothetical protein ACIA8C_01550 [Nocardia sp. NPDC051321]|uniref:hypothetical protein n=1 Tax=Nocardia sp. NPDC051321 TaxID=3364323 RepID=UPI00379D2F3A